MRLDDQKLIKQKLSKNQRDIGSIKENRAFLWCLLFVIYVGFLPQIAGLLKRPTSVFREFPAPQAPKPLRSAFVGLF